MRKIDCPRIQDLLLLDALRLSPSLAAQQAIPYFDAIALRYTVYETGFGDPWTVLPDIAFSSVKEQLKSLYSTPPVALGFIEHLRNSVGGACPVCGRDALGTLDHYLPKSTYSEFSFFSKNLVPCCDRCNNKRNALVKGHSAGERPLHPYFDNFAANRILSVQFEPDWRAPKLTPIPFNVSNHELATVRWHIENVIRPAGIDEYLIDLWGGMISDINQVFPEVLTVDDLKREILQYERYERIVSKSPNCWRSAYYHGLSRNDEAISYLFGLIS
ncbi:HNH endonuclease [Pseudomonas fluorescens]|uniref:HNH endonuclease n=1 Tax=Pseudomonas fluorescens TaxID=294 RepID=UPI001396FD49|nr:HNH endonuclease [Pseudomonas fluorescens]QIA03838.1 HNH endonuclease [Pseudomonas fluorescens]